MTARPTLREIAPTLVDNNYDVVPIPPGRKGPLLPNWQNTYATRETIDQWVADGSGDYGVGILGEKTPGVDLDISDPVLLETVLDWCKANIGVEATRVGRAPRALFACQTKTPFPKMKSRKFVAPDGSEHQIEILGKGQQYVAYAIHPDTGKPYAWSNGNDPLHVPSFMLPELTPEKAKALIEFFEASVPEGWTPKGSATVDDGERRGNPAKTSDMKTIHDALMHLPNDNVDYDAYTRVMYALWAAVGDDKSAGADMFHEWCSRSEKYVAETTEHHWWAIKEVKHLGAGSLYYMAQQAGWERPRMTAEEDLGADVTDDVAAALEEIARGAAEGVRAADEGAGSGKSEAPKGEFSIPQFLGCDAASVPPRQFLYDKHFISKFTSATFSPGGLGKSSLLTTEILAMVTGYALLGVKPVRRLRVAYWNGEDPIDEVRRRIIATMKLFGLTMADIEDRLFVGSGRDNPIKLAITQNGDLKVATPLVDKVVAYLIQNRIDVLVIDPFVTTHAISENDNTAMNAVIDLWRQIAERSGCAIELVHHSTKQARLPGQGDALGAAQARGAGAMIDGVRSARHLVGMSEEEAVKLGVDNRKLYFRTENGKSNMAPPAEFARWRKMESVSLDNGTTEYPEGDSVGVAVQWAPAGPLADLEDGALEKVRVAIAGGQWKLNEQSAEWAGYAIGKALEINCGEDESVGRGKVKRMLRAWIDNGDLVVVRRRDEKNRRESPFVEVGDISAH